MEMKISNIRGMWSAASASASESAVTEPESSDVESLVPISLLLPPAPQLLLQDSVRQSADLDVLNQKQDHGPAGCEHTISLNPDLIFSARKITYFSLP